MKKSAEATVKEKYPKMRAESHQTQGRQQYWLIRNGDAFSYYAEGKTKAQAWRAAAAKMQAAEGNLSP